MTQYKYTFANGDVVISSLPQDKLLDRMRRLDQLRVLVEQNESDVAQSICKKALRAYNNTSNFTGIIRLSQRETDWLSYLLESDMLTDKSRDVVNFYIKMN